MRCIGIAERTDLANSLDFQVASLRESLWIIRSKSPCFGLRLRRGNPKL